MGFLEDFIRLALETRREEENRRYGYYSTPTDAIEYLLDRETFEGPVWEPCCGDGKIVGVLRAYGYTVHASDIRDHDDVCGEQGVDVFDLLGMTNAVTNPPFASALAIARHLIGVVERKVALLLRIEMVGPASRRPFFRQHRPARLYPLSRRPHFLWAGKIPQSSQWEYAWFVWQRGFEGHTQLIFD
jgi:hypothetical protein